MSAVARFEKYYDQYWPQVSDALDSILSRIEGHLGALGVVRYDDLRDSVQQFMRSVLYAHDTLSKPHIEKVTAAYAYWLSKRNEWISGYTVTERQIAGEPYSVFPNISRVTLEKWIGFVEKYELLSREEDEDDEEEDYAEFIWKGEQGREKEEEKKDEE
jgi:hypothetical protein